MTAIEGSHRDGGVLLSLRFEPAAGEDPRPEEVGSLLVDLDGLYRAAPASDALGVPMSELLVAYQRSRAEAVAERLSPDWPFDFPPWLSPREFEEALYHLRARRRKWRSGYAPPGLPAPENAMRVRQLSMGSPLDFLAHIPPEYWKAGGFVLFLKAVEAYFNLPGRIRTERVDLQARRAERRADEREAELREERAARELEALHREDPPLRLVDGEVRPADEPRDA